jgi:hypothetical protein
MPLQSEKYPSRRVFQDFRLESLATLNPLLYWDVRVNPKFTLSTLQLVRFELAPVDFC